MEKRPAKTVLLIENQREEARRILDMIDDPGSPIFELSHVESMSDAEKHLAMRSVDIVLLDLGLADPQGLEAVRRVRAASPHAAIVLLSGVDSEAIAVEAIHEGAQDYLIKGQIEPRELVRALLNAAERKVIEETQFTRCAWHFLPGTSVYVACCASG
jgi:DNA-binding NarL/FixJ family response regulator